MKRIAIFASGSGSDMQSVIDGCENGDINGKVVILIANKNDIFAIERAKKHNIPYKIFTLKDFGGAEARDSAIVETLNLIKVDLIVLAGYLSIVTPLLVKAYEHKIINIHPSLIPKHCGVGFYGMKVHESVIASGDKESGATVHYVDEGADTGKIIEQVVVPVLESDSPQELQKRVLREEHILLPKVVSRLCKETK